LDKLSNNLNVLDFTYNNVDNIESNHLQKFGPDNLSD